MRLVMSFNSSSISCRERGGLNTYPFREVSPILSRRPSRYSRLNQRIRSVQAVQSLRGGGELIVASLYSVDKRPRPCNVWDSPVAFDLVTALFLTFGGVNPLQRRLAR
jgi:hypothetical protein